MGQHVLTEKQLQKREARRERRAKSRNWESKGFMKAKLMNQTPDEAWWNDVIDENEEFDAFVRRVQLRIHKYKQYVDSLPPDKKGDERFDLIMQHIIEASS
jgi:hypothetical protein